MLDYEYAVFTKEDPIKLLKDGCKGLSLLKRHKISPYIRRSEALLKKAQKFRDIITDEYVQNNMLLGYMFAAYFGEKLDKHKYLSIPRDVSYEFIRYLSKSEISKDDKYMKNATNIILAHSDSIDAFVKAFLSIRHAQGELDKLQSA